MKNITLNNLVKFTNGKTKYIITNTRGNTFDAMRVTSGSKAMWQPISIRVKVNNDGSVEVMNLNNKKVVHKQGFTTRAPTLAELKSALKNNNRYKNMSALDSWTSNYRFSM